MFEVVSLEADVFFILLNLIYYYDTFKFTSILNLIGSLVLIQILISQPSLRKSKPYFVIADAVAIQ